MYCVIVFLEEKILGVYGPFDTVDDATDARSGLLKLYPAITHEVEIHWISALPVAV